VPEKGIWELCVGAEGEEEEQGEGTGVSGGDVEGEDGAVGGGYCGGVLGAVGGGRGGGGDGDYEVEGEVSA
jgi:hypothetical protein